MNTRTEIAVDFEIPCCCRSLLLLFCHSFVGFVAHPLYLCVPQLLNLVFTKHAKSPNAWAHRRWCWRNDARLGQLQRDKWRPLSVQEELRVIICDSCFLYFSTVCFLVVIVILSCLIMTSALANPRTDNRGLSTQIVIFQSPVWAMVMLLTQGASSRTLYH